MKLNTMVVGVCKGRDLTGEVTKAFIRARLVYLDMQRRKEYEKKKNKATI